MLLFVCSIFRVNFIYSDLSNQNMGRLFIAGGGDEKKSFTVDSLFLKGAHSILYIPLAWPHESEYGTCFAWFKAAMKQHGFENIDMLTDFNKSIDLQEYSAVYLGGGNTFKLLALMRNAHFEKKLLAYYRSG